MINNTHMYLTSSGSYSLLCLAFFHKTCTPPPPPLPLMFPRHHVFNASYPALRGIYDGEEGGRRIDSPLLNIDVCFQKG